MSYFIYTSSNAMLSDISFFGIVLSPVVASFMLDAEWPTHISNENRHRLSDYRLDNRKIFLLWFWSKREGKWWLWNEQGTKMSLHVEQIHNNSGRFLVWATICLQKTLKKTLKSTHTIRVTRGIFFQKKM